MLPRGRRSGSGERIAEREGKGPEGQERAHHPSRLVRLDEQRPRKGESRPRFDCGVYKVLGEGRRVVLEVEEEEERT